MHDDDEYKALAAHKRQAQRDFAKAKKDPLFRQHIMQEGTEALQEFFAEMRQNPDEIVRFIARETKEFDYEELCQLQRWVSAAQTGALLGLFPKPPPGEWVRSKDESEFVRQQLQLWLADVAANPSETQALSTREVAEFNPTELETLAEGATLAVLAMTLGVLT